MAAASSPRRGQESHLPGANSSTRSYWRLRHRCPHAGHMGNCFGWHASSGHARIKPTSCIAVSVLVFVIVWIAGWFYVVRLSPLLHLMHPTGRSDFGRRSSTLSTIVNQVNHSGLWERSEYDSRTINGYIVWARREVDGSVTVSIKTADHGHVGMFGYLFSRRPPMRIGDDAYHPWDVPGDLPFVGDKVADNWWEAYNNLQ